MNSLYKGKVRMLIYWILFQIRRQQQNGQMIVFTGHGGFNLFLMLCKKFGNLGGSIDLPEELCVA